MPRWLHVYENGRVAAVKIPDYKRAGFELHLINPVIALVLGFNSNTVMSKYDHIADQIDVAGHYIPDYFASNDGSWSGPSERAGTWHLRRRKRSRI